jgi:hypothetical protein
MKFDKGEKLPYELRDTPGVNSYDIYGAKPLKGMGFSSVELKSIFDPRCQSKNPGPNSYNLEVDVSKRCRGCRFVEGGKGRVPFPEAQPIPGPNSYLVQLPQQAPRLRRMKSASFRSASVRDSEFSKVGVGPGIGKYVLQTANKWSQPKNTNPLVHTFGPIKDRFANSFAGNLAVSAAVPGPGMYDVNSRSFQRVRNPPHPPGKRMCKTPYLGKQNEIGNKPHTFGADKDRFKNSIYGRLDLAAESPGVGEYNLK